MVSWRMWSDQYGSNFIHPSLCIFPGLFSHKTPSENISFVKMKKMKMFTWGMGSDQYVSNVLLCIYKTLSKDLSLAKIKKMEIFTWGIGSVLPATILRNGSPSPAARNALVKQIVQICCSWIQYMISSLNTKSTFSLILDLYQFSAEWLPWLYSWACDRYVLVEDKVLHSWSCWCLNMFCFLQ